MKTRFSNNERLGKASIFCCQNEMGEIGAVVQADETILFHSFENHALAEKVKLYAGHLTIHSIGLSRDFQE